MLRTKLQVIGVTGWVRGLSVRILNSGFSRFEFGVWACGCGAHQNWRWCSEHEVNMLLDFKSQQFGRITGSRVVQNSLLGFVRVMKGCFQTWFHLHEKMLGPGVGNGIIPYEGFSIKSRGPQGLRDLDYVGKTLNPKPHYTRLMRFN